MNHHSTPRGMKLIIAIGLLSITSTAQADFLDRLNKGEPVTLAAIGTSLTDANFNAQNWFAQMGDWLSSRYPGQVRLSNRAVSGTASCDLPQFDRPHGGDWQLAQVLANDDPDVIFIEFAINDAYKQFQITPAQSRKTLKLLIDRIRAWAAEHHKPVEIVVQTMNNIGADYAAACNDVGPYYQAWAEEAAANGLLLIDHYANWIKLYESEPDHATWKSYVPDGIHPNTLGTTRVILPAIQQALHCQIPAKSSGAADPGSVPLDAGRVNNSAYRMAVNRVLDPTTGKGQIEIALDDKQMGIRLAEGTCFYRAVQRNGEQTTTQQGLLDVSANIDGSRLAMRGKLAGLDVEHVFDLPADRPIMEERIAICNRTGSRVELSDLEVGLVRALTDKAGQVLPELADDRWVALPFRCHLDQGRPNYDDFSTADLVNTRGQKFWVKVDQQGEYVPTDRRQSDGWAWTHGPHTLGIFKFDQENMQWSILAADKIDSGTAIHFGGAWMIDGEPSALSRIEPGQTVRLGVTRYQTVPGGYDQAMYALRTFLDENGCRFPKGFNPPVHWEQLYDMEGAWDDRPHKYTRAILEQEAAKGVDYRCEALYLDPGWDTDFATWLWGERWLGPRKAFVEEMHSQFGLKVSLHTPLAWWMSNGRGWNFGGDTAPSTYPPQARRQAPCIPGSNPPALWGTSLICGGSKAYLDEAGRRLLENCADGVAFLMFDGSQYQGGCDDPTHGHPVPFTREDHMRACLELARRVHAQYPAVLIEMHDMLGSGVPKRNTPVYYKYGLPGSYDSVWAGELMWQPMEHIHTGRARGLYYYNMACNVPMYLHIDLRKDNEHCLVLWWYASTCRHLGIGGTHKDPAVVAAQKAAMRKYRELDCFFKRGEFFGIGEEIHLHALPEENAFVVNLFNLSDEKRVVGGSIELGRMGLEGERLETGAEYAGTLEKGIWTAQREMAPWSAEVIHVRVAR